jgi:hypothetical protein
MPTSSASPSNSRTFASSQLGYTIQLPPSISYQGSTGGPLRSDYFSNENVGSPEQLDASGIFISIAVTSDTANQCLQHELGGATIDREYNVVVDGDAGSLKVFTYRQENLPMIVLNTLHGGYCYHFDFLSWNKAVRDANEGTAQMMLQSFRFGSGPLPTPR